VVNLKLTTMEQNLSYYKGIAFEQKFSIYMISELKYDSIKRRKSMTGNENVKGSQADIIGVKYDPRGKVYKKFAVIIGIIGVLIAILVIAQKLPDECLFFYILAVIGTVIYGLLGKKFDDKYTWVECKNRTKIIDLRMVRDFYNEVQDYNSSKDKKYAISKLIFVSASGFVDNALQFAVQKDIECYKLEGNKFKKIEY
jgi:hypothetical protein